MTTAPFEPDPPDTEEIAAADPGRGAPEPAPGFGPAEVDRDPVDDSTQPESAPSEPARPDSDEPEPDPP